MLRTSVRRLLATPGFSLVALVTIALAIAVNTAIFSWVDAALLRPLPFRDPSSLYQVWTVRSASFETPYVTLNAIREWQRLGHLFSAVEPYRMWPVTLIGAGEPETMPSAMLGGGLMETLGVRPLIGRTLVPADASPDRPKVAVIGERLWRTRFGADERILGRHVRLDDERYEIVGVMPKVFRFPRAAHQIWLPLRPIAAGERPRLVLAILRLREGVTPATASAQLLSIATAAETQRVSPDGAALRLRPYGQNPSEMPARTALMVLLAAVGVVLLLACANVAALVLVRGAVRQRELAVQAALGAGRARLMRPLVTEAVLLTVCGAAAGAVLSVWVADLLVRFSPTEIVRLSPNEVLPGWRVFSFSAVVAVLTGVLVGVLPGLRASRVDPADVLRAGGGTGTGTPGQQRFRHWLIVSELALAVMLMVGAALLARTFIGLTDVDQGFDTHKVLAVDLTIQEWKYRTPGARRQFFNTIVDRLRALPGVSTASLSGGIPPGGGFSYGLRIATEDGRVLDDETTPLGYVDVDAEYFRALGLPLVEGRPFTRDEIDSHADVLVISEALARRLWPEGGAAGRKLRMDDEDRWYTVIGVAKDVFQLEYQSRPGSSFASYAPLSDRMPVLRTVVVRAERDPSTLLRAVKSEIRAVDPDQPIVQMATAAEGYASFLSAPRFYAFAMIAFATMAALLAAIGLHGVLSYAIAQRTREFGIRLALGAEPRRLRGMVLRQGGTLMLAGAMLGVAASVYATRLLESLLVDVPRTNLVTYGFVLVVVALTSLLACWIPARRASVTDPAVTLRGE